LAGLRAAIAEAAQRRELAGRPNNPSPQPSI